MSEIDRAVGEILIEEQAVKELEGLLKNGTLKRSA